MSGAEVSTAGREAPGVGPPHGDWVATDARTAAAATLAPPRRRWGMTLLKVGVSAVLIYWILRGVALAEIGATLTRVRLELAVAAFLLFFVGYVISVNRWRVLLRAQGVPAPFGFLFRSYLVGIFFNNLLPSTIGGDTVRAYDSWRLSRDKAGALAVIAVDRLTGMMALMVLATAALALLTLFYFDLPRLLAPVLLGAAAACAGLWAALFFDRGGGSPPLGRVLPGSVRRRIERVLESVRAFGRHRRALAAALALSLVLQANVIAHYFLIGAALGLGVPVHVYALVIPIALAAMAIPISINAIGIREGAFVMLLGAFGVPAAEAVAFAWLAFLLGVGQGLLGGAVYALRR